MIRLSTGGRTAAARPLVTGRVPATIRDGLALGCLLALAAGAWIALNGDPVSPPEVAAVAAPPAGCFAEPGSDIAPFFCAAELAHRPQ